MKEGVMIVNTPAGAHRFQALLTGLKSKQVGYAALDIYDGNESFYGNPGGKVLDDEVLARCRLATTRSRLPP
jgi:lactate dehydrogenase-like 2-hydroxyacid dehydrogenase